MCSPCHTLPPPLSNVLNHPCLQSAICTLRYSGVLPSRNVPKHSSCHTHRDTEAATASATALSRASSHSAPCVRQPGCSVGTMIAFLLPCTPVLTNYSPRAPAQHQPRTNRTWPTAFLRKYSRLEALQMASYHGRESRYFAEWGQAGRRERVVRSIVGAFVLAMSESRLTRDSVELETELFRVKTMEVGEKTASLYCLYECELWGWEV